MEEGASQSIEAEQQEERFSSKFKMEDFKNMIASDANSEETKSEVVDLEAIKDSQFVDIKTRPRQFSVKVPGLRASRNSK
jgi:hypothetical protein